MSDRSGLLQSMLNYGNVKISLIGSDLQDAKVFHAVPNPQAIQAEITRRQMRVKNREKEEAENRRREEMAEYISVYHESVSGGAHAEGYVPPSAQSAPPPPNRPVQDRRRPPSVPRQRGDE